MASFVDRASAKHDNSALLCFYFVNEVVSVTDRQSRFIQEYLITPNATQAAIRAGYSKKSAASWGSRLMADPEVVAELYRLGQKSAKKFEITRDSIIQELAAVGFANVGEFITVETEKTDELCVHPITGEFINLPIGRRQHVRVIDTADIPEEKQAALASIKQGAYGIEIKLHDKVRALELLGKATGVFDNGSTAVNIENNLFNAINKSAGEDIKTDDLPELKQEAAAGDDVVETPDT